MNISYMKQIIKVIVLSTLIMANACKEEDTPTPSATISSEANLLKLELAHEGEAYPTAINGKNVALVTQLPFGTTSVFIKTIEISPEARVNIELGDVLYVDESPYSIEVTAEDNLSKQTYSLSLRVKEAPNYADLLFEQYTASNCGIYATINIGDFKVENNLWNAGALPDNSYTQCIFTYEEAGLQLLGWQWQFPDNAYGVNAYPQLIYGWKPWQAPSTTPNLPQKSSRYYQVKSHL